MAIHLSQHTTTGFLGTRASARLIRPALEYELAGGNDVGLDFVGANVTQGFVDELIGYLVLRDGPGILERLVFQGCSEDAKAILRFVTARRCADHAAANQRRESR